MDGPAAEKLRALPQVQRLLEYPDAQALTRRFPRAAVVTALRAAVDAARTTLRHADAQPPGPAALLGHAAAALEAGEPGGLRRVINATGIILHTNLGRAPLTAEAVAAAVQAAGYCTLEYDLGAGGRGSRTQGVEPLLRRLSGAEAGVAVNNCAAAVLLALSALAGGGEVVVSRGELVEIGGGFRIPDVIQQGGARLVEVGATNKTRLDDYRRAITPATRVLLKVHQSNFRIIGFTAETPLHKLAAEHGLLLVHDLGSGAAVDLRRLGRPAEMTVQDSVAAGCDVVAFSGDKLLGGPQSGLLVGRAASIDRLRRHPLLRALRLDKLTLAALEATLRLHCNGAADTVPAMRMLGQGSAALHARAARLAALLGACARVEASKGFAGGGTLSGDGIPSAAVGLHVPDPEGIAARLRGGRPAVLTSTATGQGIEALRTALAALPTAGASAGDGFPYLPIDRVFSVPGHGTVVTGTLRRGPLAVTEDVAAAPGGRPIRLRSLQVHGIPTDTAQPGQRVAANLRDIEPGELSRGMALTAQGLLPASAWLTVALRGVDGAPPLATGARLILLFGTEEVEARLRLLGREELGPGQTALAQLQCARPVAAPARERFILRRVSPPQTVAGGRVIDPGASRLRRHVPAVLAHLAVLAEAGPAQVVQAELTAAGAAGVPLKRLAVLAGVSAVRAAAMLGEPTVLARSGVAVLRAEFDRVAAAIPGVLAAQGRDLPPDRLAALLPWAGRAVLEEAVAELVRQGVLARAGGAVRLHAPDQDQGRATQEAESAGALAETLRQAGLSPPNLYNTAPGPQNKRLVDRLVKDGVLVRTYDKVQKREVVFHRDAVETAKRLLVPLLAEPPGILVGEAGAALGISRKYCVPLLEHLDAVRFTRRVADRRMLMEGGR